MSQTQTEVLQVEAPSECSDRIEAALEALPATGVSCWSPADSSINRYDVYFDNADDADRAWNAMNLQCLHAHQSGIWNLTRVTLQETDWSEAWKAHFRVEHVSPRIVIRPSWEPYEAQPGQIVLDIDPGMSFGTGRHETTRACIQFLDVLADKGVHGSFLDIGTGSGILAMTAARLGLTPIYACDLDPDAVANARENLLRNALQDQIQLATRDVASLPAQDTYTVVAANILAPVLIQNAPRIAAQVDPATGWLLLAGILQTQAADVAAAYKQEGWKVVESRRENEWESLLLSAEV